MQASPYTRTQPHGRPPAWLAPLRVWGLGRYEPKPGKVKPDKVAWYAHHGLRTGDMDTPEDKSKQVTYDEALAVFNGPFGEAFHYVATFLGPIGDGTGDVLQGIDADDVNGNGLKELLVEAPGYMELSPSRTGSHVIGRGAPFPTYGSNGSGWEMYAGGRHFAWTGLRQRDTSPDAPVDLNDFVRMRLVPAHGGGAKVINTSGTTYEVEALTPQQTTELRSALNAIPCDDRAVWVAVGFALKTLGEVVGWEMWATWSQRSWKWDPQDAAETWEGMTPTRTGYASIFSRAQALGWVNPASNAAQISPAGDGGQWINGDYWPATAPRPPDALVMRTADTVVMQSVEWVWPGFIACEFLNLVVGETSAGKSTVLADVAARVTTGRPWPGEPEATPHRMPGRVLWLGSEDPMELLTVPRLRACNADLQRVTEIQGVTRGGQRGTFSLQDDMAAVRAEIARARGGDQPYAMLVIDPITSYLHGGKLKRVDMNDSGQLRTILEPWTVLAAETGIAIVGVTHLAKDTTRSLLHRVLGGGAFAQLCRSLVAVVNRPDEGPFEKAILQVKSNLPDAQKGAWRFCTDQRVVGVSNRGRQVQANFPVWDRFDAALTPEAIAGGARGPVGKQGISFGVWLQALFATLPANEGVPVTAVRTQAVAEGIVSLKWWNEHSGEYLDKCNVNGDWMCRPKA